MYWVLGTLFPRIRWPERAATRPTRLRAAKGHYTEAGLRAIAVYVAAVSPGDCSDNCSVLRGQAGHSLQ
jgi:hypothetical protein